MKYLRRLVALLCIGLLLSCGGGLDVATGNGGGVGSGGTGIVAGTITGLGSVIVDGVRYDDSQAALETRPDLLNSVALALLDLQVGQYADLELDAAGNPTRVRIVSQLVGPAANVSAAAGQFTVWGQPVLVNTDPGRGPVTVFSGYQSLAAVHASDPVQVYGVLQSSDSGSDAIHATRVERLASPDAVPARVTGTLKPGAAGALLLAGRPLDLSAARSAPALRAGTAVTAVISSTSGIPPAWPATAVSFLAPPPASSASVNGAAHLLPSGHIVVQGVEVDLSNIAASTRQAVREGSYLRVTGSASSQDGLMVVASAVDLLPASGRPAQLRGSITSLASATSFVVRGHLVDATAAQFSGGSLRDISVGQFVEIQGSQSATSVVATTVSFDATPPDGAVLDVAGTVQSVDTATRQVQVRTPDGHTIVMTLPGKAPLPATGQTIGAAGYWQDGILQVRDIDR
jgi:hypothetical protein